MVDENVPAPAPTRSDDHILPFAAWVPIRKSNYNTLTYVEKGGTYRFQLDENWFTLDANLLREALEITPIDQAYLFVSPLSGDAIMDFMNELGYLELLTNDKCDYAELMWEEFVQAMQAFLTDKANLGSPTKKGRKDKPHVILNCRFTKLIICEVDEVFGMPIPNELISNNIRNAPYYNAYLEMVAKHDQKVAAEKEGKKKTASAKQPKSKSATEKSSKLALASKPKPAKEKLAKSSTAKPPKPKPTKEKSTKATPLQNAGKGKVAKVRNVKSSFQLVDELKKEPAQPEPKPEPGQEGKEPVVEATRPLPVVEGKGDDVTKELNLEDKTAEIDEDQAGSDPGKTSQSRLLTRERATKDEPEKLNVESGMVSMVTAPIYQASSSVPPMSTPVIDLSPPKPAPSTTQAPVFTVTTSITTTTCPLPPPPQQQSTTDSELVMRVTALEQKFATFEQKSKTLDNTTQNLRSRVFNLDLRDLPYKIDETVRQTVKEAVQVALQAPLRDRFRDLPEADMKEILHQRMFETGSYKLLPEHIPLYKALEASMERA
ncbi:hypothetical protein Tco_0736617 [Tanacetum coccineum]